MSDFTHMLRADRIEAAYRASPHLLGVSLRHRGEELLREISDIDEAAFSGRPCGIPLLYPWANRLAHEHYHAAGKRVSLNMQAPLLRRDVGGLPLHGVPWSMLRTVREASDERSLTVRIDWDDERLLAVFPFRHSLRVTASVHDSALAVTSVIHATGDDHVPVSFGFHPYLGLPSNRKAWRLRMPERSRLRLDHRGIPSGETETLARATLTLGDTSLDDAFALTGTDSEFSVTDDHRRITVQCGDGYSHVQVYAPSEHAYVCIEPMTAPVNALCSGVGLRTVAPGEQFHATFRIEVESLDGTA